MRKYLEKDKVIDTLTGLYEHIKREEHDQEAANGVWRAIEAIAALGDAWIPVAERMPEGRKDVLVYTGNGWILVAWYGTNGQSWHITPTGITHDDIIAWMPLPAPYKEVERDEG